MSKLFNVSNQKNTKKNEYLNSINKKDQSRFKKQNSNFCSYNKNEFSNTENFKNKINFQKKRNSEINFDNEKEKKYGDCYDNSDYDVI